MIGALRVKSSAIGPLFTRNRNGYNLSSFAGDVNLKRATANFTVCDQRLTRNSRIDPNRGELSTKRALDGFRSFHFDLKFWVDNDWIMDKNAPTAVALQPFAQA
jgi:hypothetical protein